MGKNVRTLQRVTKEVYVHKQQLEPSVVTFIELGVELVTLATMFVNPADVLFLANGKICEARSHRRGEFRDWDLGSTSLCLRLFILLSVGTNSLATKLVGIAREADRWNRGQEESLPCFHSGCGFC